MENNALTITILKAGNRQAFESIYRYFYKGLCAFGAQYVSLHESEEIVQDTMMWLWEHREEIDESLSLKSLLFTIVKNKALNCITRNETKQRILQELAQEHSEEFDTPDFYLTNELFRKYREALGKLTPEVQLTFKLHRHQHLTHKEIAERLNVSPQTVNYRIGQALKLLRTELKDYLPLIVACGGVIRY